MDDRFDHEEGVAETGSSDLIRTEPGLVLLQSLTSEPAQEVTSEKDKFDYTLLSEKGQLLARLAVKSIPERLKRMAKEAYHFGCELTELKDELGHGLFERFVDSELPISLKTAERLMTIRQLGGEIDKLSTLPVSTLYALAAPSTPDSAIDKAIRRVQDDGHLSLEDVKLLIKESKAPRSLPLADRMETELEWACGLLAGRLEPDEKARLVQCLTSRNIRMLREALRPSE